MTFFRIFSKFFRKVSYIIHKFLILYGGSECSQELRIFPPNNTVFSVLRYDVFYGFSPSLKFITLQLGVTRLLSGTADLASNCDCSIAFSFRDVKFLSAFKIFSKNLNKIEKLELKTSQNL